MKLLYYLNHITNHGGMERIVIDKINYFSSCGYDVHLCYFGSKEDFPAYDINSNVHIEPIIVCRFDSNSFLDKIKNIISLKDILNEIHLRVKPDIIINANANLVTWILPFINKNIPKVTELHFSYEGLCCMDKSNFGIVKHYALMCLRRLFYPKYNKLIVLNEVDKKYWGFKNIDIIPNFSNVPYEHRNIEQSSSKTVLTVGRLSSQKNYKILIDCWKIVHTNNSEWKLCIWGDGEYKDSLSNQIQRLGLSNTVFLKGVTDQIFKEYRKASFFVMSSKYEGFPLVLVEAMKSSLPCIGFNITGVNTVIENGNNGILVKNYNPESLAKAIINLMDDNKLREELASNSAESMMKYDKEKIMVIWKNLFDNLVLKNK